LLGQDFRSWPSVMVSIGSSGVAAIRSNPSPPLHGAKEHPKYDSTIKKGVSVMSFEAELIASPVASLPPQISLFHRIWPVAGLGFAVIATAAWSGFLGYELFQLVF